MKDSTHSELLLNESSETNDLLAKIAELAKVFTPISEMAALLDVNEEMRTYMKAKAETALELRKNELELARVGAPLAVQLTQDYLREMEADELI